MTIWKYEIRPFADYLQIPMRKGATILSAQIQQGIVCLWALVDPSAPVEHRSIRVAGTGHPLGDMETEKFIGTVQECGGQLVWHLFDLGPVVTP